MRRFHEPLATGDRCSDLGPIENRDTGENGWTTEPDRSEGAMGHQKGHQSHSEPTALPVSCLVEMSERLVGSPAFKADPVTLYNAVGRSMSET